MQKLGNSPVVGKCPVPGQCKICKCLTPRTDKAGKCPSVARGGGGGWAQVELTDTLPSLEFPFALNRHGIFGGLIFGPGIFWGFAGSPRNFVGS